MQKKRRNEDQPPLGLRPYYMTSVLNQGFTENFISRLRIRIWEKFWSGSVIFVKVLKSLLFKYSLINVCKKQYLIYLDYCLVFLSSYIAVKNPSCILIGRIRSLFLEARTVFSKWSDPINRNPDPQP